MMLQQDQPEDFVIATGVQYSVRQFVEWSAICRQLELTDVEIITANRDKLDLANQAQVAAFFGDNKFDQVYLVATKVGGIHSNNEYPAEFIYQNLMIEANIIHAANTNNVQKLLFLGSSCIYPKIGTTENERRGLINRYFGRH